MPYSPFMDQVTVNGPNTARRLSDLIAAIDPNVSTRASYVRLEDDASNGAGNTFIGNSNVSSAHCGFHIVSGQEAPIVPLGDMIVGLTSDIWISSDQASRKINVTIIPIGA